MKHGHRTLKRILSICMVLVLLAVLMPTSVSAAEATFTTFEELKAICEEASTSEYYIEVYYTGEEALKITESLTIPEALIIYAPEVTVSSSATVTNNGYLYTDTLTLNGKLNNYNTVYAYVELSVNALLTNYYRIYISNDGNNTGLIRITYSGMYAKLYMMHYVSTESELRTALSAANADTSGVHVHLVYVNEDAHITLTQDTEFASNVLVGVLGRLTVDEGITLTSENVLEVLGGVNIMGTVQCSTGMLVYQTYGASVYFYPDGVYDGVLYVAAETSNDAFACIQNREVENVTLEEEYLWNVTVHMHEWGEPVIIDPTCAASGTATYTCTCAEMKTEYIFPLDHTEVIDPAVEPTDTESGLTEGKHCSVCGEILVAQEIIPAIGSVLTWTFADGTLTISGKVSMEDYSGGSPAPWSVHASEISAVVLEEGVTSIGNYAFRGLSALKSVDIPASVTAIGKYAFYNCTALTGIAIPDTVTSIESSAFRNCTALKSMDLPDALETIRDSVFDGCTSLKSVDIPNSVIGINGRAFDGCSALTSVKIPESVEYIQGYAFADCTSLKSVTLPDTISLIFEGTFRNCTSLTSINIPDSVQVIRGYAFESCTSLKSVELPDSIEEIANNAFENCKALTKVTFPKTLAVGRITIGEAAFRSCTTLNSINLPAELTSILDGTFQYCSKLKSITLPEALMSIGTNAFFGCTALSSIDIPDAVATIGYHAFYGCTALKTVQLPDSLREIRNSVFEECTALTTINLPDTLTSIGSKAFMRCTSLKSVDLPNGITVLGNAAFWGCTRLASVDLPDSLETIEQSVFQDCAALKQISIPDTVTSIDRMAFSRCTKLSEITFEGNAPEFILRNGIGEQFENVTAKAYYPSGSATWTEDVMQDYNGNITWISYETGCIHTWDDGAVTVPAACTTSGTVTYTCTICGETKTEAVPATGHTEVIDAAVDATCSETGLTEGKHCSVCNEVILAQEIIAATGHTWGEWVTTVEPTEEADGTAERKCNICGETESKPVPMTKLGDVNGDGKLNAKDATAILKYIVGKLDNAPANFELLADVNADGKVNAKDATKILKTIVGKDTIEGWE